jgi:hypothetical protein
LPPVSTGGFFMIGFSALGKQKARSNIQEFKLNELI